MKTEDLLKEPLQSASNLIAKGEKIKSLIGNVGYLELKIVSLEKMFHDFGTGHGKIFISSSNYKYGNTYGEVEEFKYEFSQKSDNELASIHQLYIRALIDHFYDKIASMKLEIESLLK